MSIVALACSLSVTFSSNRLYGMVMKNFRLFAHDPALFNQPIIRALISLYDGFIADACVREEYQNDLNGTEHQFLRLVAKTKPMVIVRTYLGALRK